MKDMITVSPPLSPLAHADKKISEVSRAHALNLNDKRVGFMVLVPNRGSTTVGFSLDSVLKADQQAALLDAALEVTAQEPTELMMWDRDGILPPHDSVFNGVFKRHGFKMQHSTLPDAPPRYVRAAKAGEKKTAAKPAPTARGALTL